MGKWRKAYWHASWYERLWRKFQCRFIYYHEPATWEWLGHKTKPLVCMRCGKQMDYTVTIDATFKR